MRSTRISLYTFSVHIINTQMIFVKIVLSSLEYDWTVMTQLNQNNSFDVVLSFKVGLRVLIIIEYI